MAKGFAHESTRNESIEWYTPPELFDALDVQFDLDPCSPGKGKSFVPADNHFTIDDDGLTQDWDGLVFMNPPYGSETAIWLEKLADHGDGIALVFARTDVQWFHTHVVEAASLVCFVEGRVRFFHGSVENRGGSPGAGSMLVAYGDRAARIVTRSGLGATFQLVQPPVVEEAAA